MSARRRKKVKAWSPRKFLLLWHLYRSRETIFDLIDLVFPHLFPRSIHTPSHELIRMLTCATNLGPCGVSLSRALIDHFTLSILDKNKQVLIDQQIVLDELCPDLPSLLFRELGIEEKGAISLQPNLASNLLGSVLAAVLGKVVNRFRGLDQEGNGLFQPDESQSNLDTKLFTHLAPLLSLDFEIDRRRLNHVFRRYLLAFSDDQIKPSKGQKYFPQTTVKQVFQAFIHHLVSEQGSYITFELDEGSHALSGQDDSFIQVFKGQFPQAFKLWRSGVYYFPFFEMLAWAEAQKWLKVQEFVVTTNGIGIFEKLLKRDHQARHRNFNEVKLKAYLSLEIYPGPLRPVTPSHKTVDDREINLVEVVASDRPRFKVYLNGDHRSPIYLTKNNKAGEIIYSVASGIEVSFRHYRKNMDYINHDPNFKLYSQSDYLPTMLLDKQIDEDGNAFIGPAKGVEFRLT